MGGFSSDAFKMFETLMIQHFVKLAECKGEFLYKI